MIRVSVIVAAYNAQAYLGRAIDSVLAQSETSLELILVDDRSTDDTLAVAQRYVERDGRVRLLEGSRNGGPGFARNLALAAAQGEWVAILDADDAFRPERLAELLALAQAHDADVISDNLLLRDGLTGEITGAMFPPDRFVQSPQVLTPTAFVAGNMGPGRGARVAYGYMKPLIRRDFLAEQDIRYRVSRFAEDYIFGLDLLCADARWLVTPQAWYEYDIRPNSLSVKVSPADGQAVVAAERELLARPTIRAQPDLVEAIGRHQRSLELSIAWVRFAEALKARDLRTAAAVALSDVATTAHVAKEAARHLPQALRLFRHEKTAAGSPRPSS